jgi:hypothetical protein
MSKPVILTVDDDPLGSAPIGRDLLRHHGADYRGLESMKRVASAVGEAAMSAYRVHRYPATV